MSGNRDPKATRVLPRLLHVARVLFRHRLLGALLGRRKLPPPQAVRKAIEELGLTYIKLGQVLAMQRGLLPEAYIDELALLHDRVPAMDVATVRAIVESELGEPVYSLFLEFSETPLGAASIAQVHDATLWDGRRVAVKVQRPDLGEVISRDIAALNFLVRLGERFIPHLRLLNLPAVLQELSNGLRRETDFSREASSITVIRNTTTEYPDVWIPEVIADYTRGAVLTMEFSAGERIDTYARQHPEAMPQAMNTLVSLMMQTIFEDGLFHVDPHPGNVFVLPDGRLSLLDFGSTGELDERMREALSVLLESVIRGDAEAATIAYLEMAPESERVNRVALQNDIKAALYEIRRSNVAGVSIGKVFEALVEGEYANPVIVVDEIDKASSDAQYDPLGALYSLLEYDTAQSFTDEFAEVAIDASQVIWITTANDTRGIPDPILNRMNVFEVEAPTLEQARTIARNLYQGIRAGHDWGRLIDPEPLDDVLDHLAQMPPREMRRALMTGFGNARLDRRSTVEITDLPKAATGRSRIGFVQ